MRCMTVVEGIRGNRSMLAPPPPAKYLDLKKVTLTAGG